MALSVAHMSPSSGRCVAAIFSHHRQHVLKYLCYVGLVLFKHLHDFVFTCGVVRPAEDTHANSDRRKAGGQHMGTGWINGAVHSVTPEHGFNFR